MEKIMASGKFVNKLTGRVNYNDADYVIGINEKGNLFAFWSMSGEGGDIEITLKQAIAGLESFIEQDKESIKFILKNTKATEKMLKILKAKEKK